MSTYFSSKIGYIIEDFLDKRFDFGIVRENLLEKLHAINGKEVFWKSLKELKMGITVIAPDMDALMASSKIKSHEFDAIVEKVADMVRNSIALVANKIAHTIKYYKYFKNSIFIQHTIQYSEDDLNHSQRNDIITMSFLTEYLDIQDVIGFLNLWNLQELCVAKHIEITFHVVKKGTANDIPLLTSYLEKKDLAEVQDYLSIEDSEILHHPCYFKILKSFMFPEGFQSKAEITLDIAQETLAPKKRRTVMYDSGRKGKFHEILTNLTPYKKYSQIIRENNISGIYCSVRSTNDEILYLLIDIDVPSLFYAIFSRQIVWQLILNIVDALKLVVSRFGLPPFKVMFSGAKGVHLLWSLDRQAIVDYERHVNLPELSNRTIPGIRNLKREKVSSVNDMFKFTKTLLQSILLHTVYKGNIKIPQEIIQKLKVYHPYQIFRLSPDSKNCLSILLDCSSQAKGVFRLFSPHPSTRLVSIPLSDLNTEDSVMEKYRNYQMVVEDARIENVLQRFEKNEIELFLQFPNFISRRQIRKMLRPDNLFPTFSILLRFGVMYSIERSPPSFGFWFRFYELKSFYEYVEKSIYFYKEEFAQDIIEYLENVALNLNIKNSENITQILIHYMIEKKISYPVARQLISNLYYKEFFFDLKSNIFLRENQDNLLTLFSEQIQFSNFLNQAENLFNLAVNAVITLIISNHQNLPKHQQTALKQFNSESLLLLDLTRTYLSELRSDKGSIDKEQQLIDTIYFISQLYFSSIVFLNKFYNLQEEQTRWK